MANIDYSPSVRARRIVLCCPVAMLEASPWRLLESAAGMLFHVKH
jgi:hypothetical protein